MRYFLAWFYHKKLKVSTICRIKKDNIGPETIYQYVSPILLFNNRSQYQLRPFHKIVVGNFVAEYAFDNLTHCKWKISVHDHNI